LFDYKRDGVAQDPPALLYEGGLTPHLAFLVAKRAKKRAKKRQINMMMMYLEHMRQ
jgi:hypothetical protein